MTGAAVEVLTAAGRPRRPSAGRPERCWPPGSRPGDRVAFCLPVVGRAAVRRARRPPRRRGAGAVERHPARRRARRADRRRRPGAGDHRPRRTGRAGRRAAGRAGPPPAGPAHALHLGHHRTGQGGVVGAVGRGRRPPRPSPTRPTCGRSDPTTSTWSARPMYHSVSVRFAGGTLLRGGTCVVLEPVRRRRGRRTPWPAAGTGPCPPPPSWPRRHCSRLLDVSDEQRRPASTRCGCWSTPVRPARPPSSGGPWPGSAPGSCGSSTAPPRASSPCARPTSGWPGPARWAGPGPGGPCRSTTTGPSGAARPAFARFTYWRDEAKTAAAWRDGCLHRRRPRPAGRRRLPLHRRPPRRPDHQRRRQRLPGRGGGGAERGARRGRGRRVRAGRRALGPAGLRRRGGHGRPGIRGRRRAAARLRAALEDRASARLAAYKRPKQYVVVDALPRTATGKVQRHLISPTGWSGDRCPAEATAPDDPAMSRSGHERCRRCRRRYWVDESRRRRPAHRHHQPGHRRAAPVVRALRRRRRSRPAWPRRLRPRPGGPRAPSPSAPGCWSPWPSCSRRSCPTSPT